MIRQILFHIHGVYVDPKISGLGSKWVSGECRLNQCAMSEQTDSNSPITGQCLSIGTFDIAGRLIMKAVINIPIGL